ncbi:MAG: hypothetical protein RIR34_445 [Actinomycetota bacterium]|jgi:hypothetical protein
MRNLFSDKETNTFLVFEWLTELEGVQAHCLHGDALNQLGGYLYISYIGFKMPHWLPI